MAKIPEILKPAPLHKTLPALAGVDSVGRIRAAWRTFRAAMGCRQRTKLEQIPAELRPRIARSYRVSAAGFVVAGAAMAYSAFAFFGVMPWFSAAATIFAAPACILIATLKLWQAAMIERGAGMSFHAWLAGTAAE